jgi:ribosomal protein S18 acetylase RimI-like enzyme
MMSSSDRFLIRPFRPADREPLDELWTRVFPDDPTWNAPAVIIENKLKVQPELLLVGELDGTIVGALMAGFDGVRGWLYHLAVAPEFRRRGFATGLVRAAEDRLRRLGCRKVNLQVRPTNHDVVAFYRTVGYEVEERVSMGHRLEELDNHWLEKGAKERASHPKR